MVMISLASNEQDELMRTGTRVPGIVIDVKSGFRSCCDVEYRYTVNGREHIGLISGIAQSYDAGQRVSVYVDPEDPNRSTLPGEQPQSAPARLVTIASFSLAVVAFGALVVDFVRAARARRPSRRTQRTRMKPPG